MSEFFDVTSTSVSDETDPMRMEIERLKAKSSQDNAKIKALKKQVSDLTLKIQLLEEENKLLQTTRVVAPQKKQENVKTIPQSKVTEVLLGFDQLIEQNSKEISALLNDRDKLSSICFNSLALISSQELVIQKFKSAIQKLFRFLANSNESVEPVIRDFRTFGIDVSNELNSLKRQIQVTNFVSNITIDPKQKVDAKDIQQILKFLPQMPMNESSMKTVAQYLMQRVDDEIAYNKMIEELTAQKQSIEKDYQKLLSKLCEKSKKVNLKHALEQIEAYTRTEKQLNSNETLISNLVDTFVQFGDKFGKDLDIQNCVSRIRFWNQGSIPQIDIIQEIDFLLGMCITERKVKKVMTDNYNNDSSSEPKLKKCRLEKKIIRQVKEIKENVIDMKDKLEDANRKHYKHQY